MCRRTSSNRNAAFQPELGPWPGVPRTRNNQVDLDPGVNRNWRLHDVRRGSVLPGHSGHSPARGGAPEEPESRLIGRILREAVSADRPCVSPRRCCADGPKASYWTGGILRNRLSLRMNSNGRREPPSGNFTSTPVPGDRTIGSDTSVPGHRFAVVLHISMKQRRPDARHA